MPGLPKKLTTAASAAALLVAVFCAAYGADAGRGFIKDDFRWIRETAVDTPAGLPRLFERSDGFYRPIVSLTFAFNSALFGIAPRPYGLTNLLLAIATAVLLWRLARTLRLGPGPALLAAAAWAFNFHGINMAVLWVSGRTSLVATAFALLTACASLRHRGLTAGACCLLALLSKEEAVLLPLAIAAWAAYDAQGAARDRLRSSARRAWPCFAALAVYLLLRARTDAFWPSEAPAYYRLTISAAALAGNILQYADRAITVSAVAAVVVAAAARLRVSLDAGERRAIVFGAIWLVCGFGVTVFVPARSSLYAVLPSAGAALASGAVASAALRAAPRPARAAMAVLAVVPMLLLPVYWQRNVRWVRLADLSTRVLSDVAAVARAHPGRPIVLVDNPDERFNLDAAFGSLWPDAAALYLPDGTQATLGAGTTPPAGAVTVRLHDGHLVRER